MFYNILITLLSIISTLSIYSNSLSSNIKLENFYFKSDNNIKLKGFNINENNILVFTKITLKRPWYVYGKVTSGIGVPTSINFIYSKKKVTPILSRWSVPKFKILNKQLNIYYDNHIYIFNILPYINNLSSLNTELTYSLCSDKACSISKKSIYNNSDLNNRRLKSIQLNYFKDSNNNLNDISTTAELLTNRLIGVKNINYEKVLDFSNLPININSNILNIKVLLNNKSYSDIFSNIVKYNTNFDNNITNLNNNNSHLSYNDLSKSNINIKDFDFLNKGNYLYINNSFLDLNSKFDSSYLIYNNTFIKDTIMFSKKGTAIEISKILANDIKYNRDLYLYLYNKNNYNLGTLYNISSKYISSSTNIPKYFIKRETQSYLYYFFNINILLIVFFFSGIIINLLPCIVPILPLKVYLLLDSKSLIKNKLHRVLIFITGGITAFIILAFIIVLLKIISYKIVWGIQFYSSFFVAIVILYFIWIVLYLYGVVSIGLFKFNVAGLNNNIIRYYFDGFVYAMLSASCSGPGLGYALTILFFTKSYILIFVYMITMGLGLFVPICIMTYNESILGYFIKNKGKMIIANNGIFNKLLTLILLIVILYYSYIFYIISNIYQIIVFFIFIVFGLVYLMHLYKYKNIFIIFKLIIAIAIIICTYKFTLYFNVRLSNKWVEYKEFKSNVIYSNIKNSNRVVFIQYTSDWCMTCNINSSIILESGDMIKFFKDNNVLMIKADLTKYNKGLINSMYKYSSALPVYIFMKNNKEVVLPTILTKSIIKRYFNKLK